MSSATERYFDRSERVPDTWAPNNSDCVPETWTSELQSHGRVGGSAWSSFSNPSVANLRAQDGGAHRICRPVPTHASGAAMVKTPVDQSQYMEVEAVAVKTR